MHARKIDAGDERQVKGLVAECMETYGRLDVFFANAGVSGTMERIYDDGEGGEKFMEVMRVNALRYVCVCCFDRFRFVFLLSYPILSFSLLFSPPLNTLLTPPPPTAPS